jgi:hypothetical protein
VIAPKKKRPASPPPYAADKVHLVGGGGAGAKPDPERLRSLARLVLSWLRQQEAPKPPPADGRRRRLVRFSQPLRPPNGTPPA